MTWHPQVKAIAHGRTELAGNHTDHEGGTVLAATIDCACKMTAAAEDGTYVRISCDGFDDIEFDLARPDALIAHKEERYTTAALIRGCIVQLVAHNIAVRGFSAQLTSSIPSGAGLSSSAAVELACICTLDALFGHNDIDACERARMAKIAECEYYGKPCGLMDQTAIACGGIVAIDFRDEEKPAIERIDYDFDASDWSILLVDSRAEHGNQTSAFAELTDDMHAVAKLFGLYRLEDVGAQAFFARFADTRERLGDRATLRALHYFNEVSLVRKRIAALKAADMPLFVELTRRSSASSAQYLQNLSVAGSPDQSAMVALALCDIALDGRGSCRIHGGGFGGLIQIILPRAIEDEFATRICAYLGKDCCRKIKICDEGARAAWI